MLKRFASGVFAIYAYGISTIVTTHMDQFSCSLINYETAVLSVMKVTSFPEVFDCTVSARAINYFSLLSTVIVM